MRQVFFFGKRSTLLSGTLVSLTLPGVRISLVFDLKIVCFSRLLISSSSSTNVSQVFFHCLSMQHFVSRRSSSSVDLDSFLARRADRAGRHRLVCWSVLATSQAAVRTSSFRVVTAYSGQTGGAQEAPSTGRPHMRRSLIPALVPSSHPLQPMHPLRTSPAAARQNAAKSTSTPVCATGSSTCPATGRQNGNGAYRSAWVRSGACQDIRGDQPEHSLPLETQRATSSTVRQEWLKML